MKGSIELRRNRRAEKTRIDHDTPKNFVRPGYMTNVTSHSIAIGYQGSTYFDADNVCKLNMDTAVKALETFYQGVMTVCPNSKRSDFNHEREKDCAVVRADWGRTESQDPRPSDFFSTTIYVDDGVYNKIYKKRNGFEFTREFVKPR